MLTIYNLKLKCPVHQMSWEGDTWFRPADSASGHCRDPVGAQLGSLFIEMSEGFCMAEDWSFLCWSSWCSSGVVVKDPPANAGDIRDVDSIPGLGRYPGEASGNKLHSCLENPHGQRSLVGYSQWGCKELAMTQWLSKCTHTHTQIRKGATAFGARCCDKCAILLSS